MDLMKSLMEYNYAYAVDELRLRSSNRNDPLSLSSSNLFYILIIEQNPGCTISDIAEMIGVTTAAATIKQDSQDKRKKKLYITETCVKDNEKFNALKRGQLEQLEERFSKEELAVFSSVLKAYGEVILGTEMERYNLRLGESNE